MSQIKVNEGNSIDQDTLLVQRTIRSGQSLRHRGSIVILGDVNPGAEVVAGGSIVVLGSLRGMAHAGALGDLDVIVTAFRLEPTQMRIGNYITRAPDNEKWNATDPEVARVREGNIFIEKLHGSLDHFNVMG